MELSSRQTFVAVLVTGLVGTGLLVRLLNELGYFTAGVVIWIIGYGGTVLILWYGWIRPLDLTGPTGQGRSDGESEPETADGK